MESGWKQATLQTSVLHRTAKRGLVLVHNQCLCNQPLTVHMCLRSVSQVSMLYLGADVETPCVKIVVVWSHEHIEVTHSHAV